MFQARLRCGPRRSFSIRTHPRCQSPFPTYGCGGIDTTLSTWSARVRKATLTRMYFRALPKAEHSGILRVLAKYDPSRSSHSHALGKR